MKVGDLVKATWSDGLILEGKYLMNDKGYVILIDSNGEKIVCNPNNVRFEIIKEVR